MASMASSLVTSCKPKNEQFWLSVPAPEVVAEPLESVKDGPTHFAPTSGTPPCFKLRLLKAVRRGS